MKTTNKVFQVQGNGKAHYVSASSKSKALKLAKEVYPMEKIDFAEDMTDSFKQYETLPDYVLIAE